LGARHQVNHCPIQNWWPNTHETEFEPDNNSLSGRHPSSIWIATSNVNLDVAIQARFSGNVILQVTKNCRNN
jgi:hypothetical protein